MDKVHGKLFRGAPALMSLTKSGLCAEETILPSFEALNR